MKKAGLPLLFCFLPFLLFSLEVDLDELRTQDIHPIEYINFTGDYAFINTADEVFGIGRQLELLRRRDGEEGRLGDKYVVLRIHPLSEAGSRGADILRFQPGAMVDHIENIRRILSGYLSESFGYDVPHARQLAESITIYNTILRGRIEYFAERYIADVLRRLDAGSVGLSRYYSDWAGSTNIVIPIVYRSGVADRAAERAAARTEAETDEAADRELRRRTEALERERAETAPPITDRVQPDPASPEAAAAPAVSEPEEEPAAEVVSPRDAPSRIEVDEEEVEEVLRTEAAPGVREPERAAEPVAEREGLRSGRYVLYGFVILLLLILLFLLLRGLTRKQRDLKESGSAYISPGKGGEKTPNAREIAAMERPVVMQMVYHDFPLSRKTIRSIPSGEVKSVGGAGAYFAVPVLNLPKRVAEIENDGRHFVFIPHEKEYLPGIDRPMSDFFGKEILVVSKEGEKAVLVFREYVSPLEEINRVLRSISPPPGEDEPSGGSGKAAEGE